MATIRSNVTEQIISEINLFGPTMPQNVIENEFNFEYATLATIQPSVAIEYTVKGANDLYFDSNNFSLHMLVKITKADETNIDANTAAPINLTLNSMFREIGLELNDRKCWRHEPAVPVSLTSEDSYELQLGNPNNTFPERGMNTAHERAHGFHRSGWEQCRVEHSRNKICEKCRGRAHQSRSFGRLSARAPYSSKY